MPMYTYRCCDDSCGFLSEYVIAYDERQVPQECKACGELAFYTIAAPMVLKASYPDGHRRKNHEDWNVMREYQKLRNKRMLDRSGKKVPKDDPNLNKEIEQTKKRFRPRNDRGGSDNA